MASTGLPKGLRARERAGQGGASGRSVAQEPALSPLETATEGPRLPETQGPQGWSLFLPLSLTVDRTEVQREVTGQ